MKPARRLSWLSNVVGAPAAAGAVALLLLPAACTPDVTRDPIPEEMEFDPDAMPPRVPEPTSLIVNPMAGLLDFRLAGTTAHV